MAERAEELARKGPAYNASGIQLRRKSPSGAAKVMSAQLDIPFTRIPPRESQCYAILIYLQAGGRLTVAKALSELGVYALSQRCGDLRRKYGWPVLSRTVETNSGAKISEYFL